MDIILIGAGGHGRVVLDAIRAAGAHRVVGFLDANEGLAGTAVDGVPVLGAFQLLLKLRESVPGAFVSIGDNPTRQSYARMLREKGFELVQVVHPRAIVAPNARIDNNVYVAPGAVVCAGAEIAEGVILNTSCVVDHECQVGEYAHIGPGALLAGRVRVGPRAFVGMGASVIPCLNVAEECQIGAGAVVIRDVPHGAKAVGVPARCL
jgi:sugar O-acyltransferase (sialic acid O-acetyltransferase NeuD family)